MVGSRQVRGDSSLFNTKVKKAFRRVRGVNLSISSSKNVILTVLGLHAMYTHPQHCNGTGYGGGVSECGSHHSRCSFLRFILVFQDRQFI